MEQASGKHYANKRANYSAVDHRRSFDRIAQVEEFIDSVDDSHSIEESNQKFRQPQKRWHEERPNPESQISHKHSRRLDTQVISAEPRSDQQPAVARSPHVDVLEGDLEDEEEQEQEQQFSVENGSDLEEVYLCNCCGITKELEPAMKYMPAFRSLFYLFNFLSFAFAFVLLGLGLWYRIDPKVYELRKYIETQNFTIAGWIMLFGGFLASLLNLEGCRATSKKSVRSLLFYCIVMTIITLAFIGALVLVTVHGLGSRLERFMSKEIYDQIRRKAMSTELDLQYGYDAAQFLDFVQVKLRCCGSIDFRDYQKLGMVIPATCYTIAGNYINAPGCAQAIRELFDLRAGLAAGFTAASVIAQLLAIVFAALIVCSIYNYRANPRPASTVSTFSDQNLRQTAVATSPPPPQFESSRKKSAARTREFERSRPSSRSSLTSIRV